MIRTFNTTFIKFSLVAAIAAFLLLMDIVRAEDRVIPSTQPMARVTIDNFTFSPQTLTVQPGTKVTWINHDDVPHTVTSTAKPRTLDSRAMDSDETFTFTFDKPGTYAYFCAVHPHMTGQIIVK